MLGNPNISSRFPHVHKPQLYEISLSKALLPWQLHEFREWSFYNVQAVSGP